MSIQISESTFNNAKLLTIRHHAFNLETQFYERFIGDNKVSNSKIRLSESNILDSALYGD